MSLRLDFCSAEAARYACEKWHYSRSLPAGKTVKIGVWEDNKYIGCIIYGQGANHNIGKPFGLKQTEVAELVRVALNKHKSFVSKIISISLRILKKACPGLLLIVSYADEEQGHNGSIYQAGNWIFIGTIEGCKQWFLNGQKIHPKTIAGRFGTNDCEKIKKAGFDIRFKFVKGKNKYIMPLTKEMRVKFEKFALEYPKRAPVVQE